MSSVLPPYLASSSLAFRASLAQRAAPLARVQSKTPFFELPAHRIPTRWGLYRGLLRRAPTDDIKFRVRVLFRWGKGSTGVGRTVKDLEKGYKWLDFFNRAKAGDAHCAAALQRFSSLIAVRREKAFMLRLAREEIEWQAKQRHRPILTGGYMRPTLNHGPLPRMKPQPPAISHLIIKRMKKRELRHAKKMQLEDNLQDLKFEQRFEEGLLGARGVEERVFSDPAARRAWREPIGSVLQGIKASQAYEYARAASTFPPQLIDAILAARREKVRNKTHEKNRERRGEDTLSALRRKRKAPPAHVLARMTPRQREMDAVSRSVSEVGYVAMVKRRLGFKLKDPGRAEVLERGEEGNRVLLDEAARMIRKENRRRKVEEADLISRAPTS